MKKVVERKLSSELLRTLDAGRVAAVAFAEVGAQGCPQWVEIVSENDEGILADSGCFGFEFNGERMSGDVEVEELEAFIPFLKYFKGTSIETTVRGDFKSQDGEWIHLDFGGGNHFILRAEFFERFVAEANKIPGFEPYGNWFDALKSVLGAE